MVNSADLTVQLSCSESVLEYPNKTGTERNCGCFNCVQDCPVPDDVRIDMSTDQFREEFPIDRSPKKCVFYNGCGKNLLLPNGEGQGLDSIQIY